MAKTDPSRSTGEPARSLPARSLNGRGDKRTRILAAGLKLFANQSYQQVTMDKVARVARVAKGTLYLYFSSKESLYLGILSEGLNGAAENIRSRLSTESDISERLQQAISATIEFYHGRSDFLRLLATEEPRVGAARGRLLQSWRESGMQFFSSLIEEGISRGAFRPLDPRVVAFAIIGTIRLVLLHRDSNRPLADINRDLASLLFDGLLARRGKTNERRQ
jgi:AcrR family transcriptional regulator